MAPSSAFSLALAIAEAVAATAFASALLLLVALVAMRLARNVQLRHIEAQQAHWRTAMHEASLGDGTATLPPIAPRDLPEFLRLWNHLSESLRGESARHLAALLRASGLVPAVRSLLGEGSLWLRLIASTSLGHLRDEECWPALRAQAAERNAVSSFAAARALLRIAPGRALEELLPEAVRRDDWSLARLGSALQEAGPDKATPPIAAMLASPPDEGLERLLKLARYAHRERVAPIIRGWLDTQASPNVVVAALLFAEDASDLAHVRSAARHADWRIRMASAKALRRIGDERELPLLLAMLEDPAWWVRYHAAHALHALPRFPEAELAGIRSNARDSLAAGMLSHVAAEREAP